MGQDQKRIVIGKIRTHIVFRQILSVDHWQGHGAIFVHNVHISDRSVAVILRYLIVHHSIGTGPAISRVTLYNGWIGHRLHQRTDQICAEVVTSRFASRELHSDLVARGPTQFLVDSHQTIRRNICCHIDNRNIAIFPLGNSAVSSVRQITVQNHYCLCAGCCAAWFKAIIPYARHNATSLGPIHGSLRKRGNSSFIRVILCCARGRTVRIPPENRSYLLTGNRHVRVKLPIIIVPGQPLSRAPSYGITVPGITSTAYRRTSSRPVKDRQQHGMGHCFIWRKGCVSGSAHHPIFPTPLSSLGVPRARGYIGKADRSILFS